MKISQSCKEIEECRSLRNETPAPSSVATLPVVPWINITTDTLYLPITRSFDPRNVKNESSPSLGSELNNCLSLSLSSLNLLLPPPLSIACSLFRPHSDSNRLSNALFGLTDMNNRSQRTFTLINFQVSPVLCRRINHNGGSSANSGDTRN